MEEAAEARHKIEVLGRCARSQDPQTSEEGPGQGSLPEDPEEDKAEVARNRSTTRTRHHHLLGDTGESSPTLGQRPWLVSTGVRAL